MASRGDVWWCSEIDSGATGDRGRAMAMSRDRAIFSTAVQGNSEALAKGLVLSGGLSAGVDGAVDANRLPTHWKGLSAITDGTSNTIAFSETLTSDGRTSTTPDMGAKTGVVTGANGPVMQNISVVLTFRDPSNPNMLRAINPSTNAATVTNICSWRGIRVFNGRGPISSFHTVLPPNSPSWTPTSANNAMHLMSATSGHTGGVNGLFFDGAVRFISETIDSGDYSVRTDAIVIPAGTPSYFGVWGAMGSINGNETKSF